jgi:hypothetical protein
MTIIGERLLAYISLFCSVEIGQSDLDLGVIDDFRLRCVFWLVDLRELGSGLRDE